MLLVNDIEYVLAEMGKPIVGKTNAMPLDQFVTLENIDNPISTITPPIIRTVMNAMVWPKMGKTQFSVNKKALTDYNAVIRFYKDDETTNRTEAEVDELVRVVLRRRGYMDK